jgi:hypothetical protein
MAKSEHRRRVSKDTLNLVIAMCAVLISGASFYATYLQAQSEEKQVKAATWPYLQFSSGNYNIETEEEELYLRIENVGVGPAMIKNFSMSYEDIESHNVYNLLAACCIPEGEDKLWLSKPEVHNKVGLIVTDTVNNRILPVGNAINVVMIKKTDGNEEFWNKVNHDGRKIKGQACYCSLLDNCYQTDFVNEPVLVKSCKPS